MTPEDRTEDPWPGIRAVLLAGCLTGNACGLLILLAAGTFFRREWLSPYPFLVLAGCMLGVGLLGAMLGTFLGLLIRLILVQFHPTATWKIPAAVSAVSSGVIGSCIAFGAVLWMNAPSR